MERLVEWIVTDTVNILGNLSRHRLTISEHIFDQFCRVYEKDKGETLDIYTVRRVLEFFRPVIERQFFPSYLIHSKNMLHNLLDSDYEEDAIWLFGVLIRVNTIITKTPNFHFEFSKSKGEETTDILEYELRYELTFADQLLDYVNREYFKNIFIPRINKIGLKLANFLTQKFIEARTIESRGGKELVRSDYMRSAIEPHEQDSIHNDPINFLLNLLRDCWEELLKVNRAQAEQVFKHWESVNDGLIERLRIHALTKLVELSNDHQ